VPHNRRWEASVYVRNLGRQEYMTATWQATGRVAISGRPEPRPGDERQGRGSASIGAGPQNGQDAPAARGRRGDRPMGVVSMSPIELIGHGGAGSSSLMRQ
jgi:hypothetical protein